MQKDSPVTTKVSEPEIPENAFIFDPDCYWILNGKLQISSETRFKNTARLGYFFVALGIFFFLFEFFKGPLGAGFWVVLAALAFFGSLGFYLLKSSWRHNYFNNTGKITVGKLVSIEGKAVMVSQRKSTIHYKITAKYSFFGPGHQTQIVGETIVRREDLKNQALPAPGTPVVVLYINPQNYLAC